MNKRILIIGSGLAGITLVRELRKRDKECEIVVVTADDGSFYSKPNLSNAFAAGKQPAELVLAAAAKLEQDLGIRILPQTAVAGIDAQAREVVTARGKLSYDKLVLAVGGSQIHPSLAGDGTQDVISVNSLTDYTRLHQRLEGKRSVAIIGAGLIGCEFANDMSLGGYSVSLFDIAAQPLARLLPTSAATRLRKSLESIGVSLNLPVSLAAIQRDGSGYILIDQQGRSWKYDLVLSAIGLRPNIALAKTASLATNLGIVTDPYLRTSDPHIYALGDCVELEGKYQPYVQPIMQGAKKLACTLTGTPEAVEQSAMPIVLKTPVCPTVICPPGGEVPGRWDETISDAGVRAIFIDQDSSRPAGFVLQGGFTKERVGLAAMMQGSAKQ